MLPHVNARSLHKNFESLSDFLQPLKHKPHGICISESQIISQPLLNLGLENYCFAHVSPIINRVGGVAVYVHDDISLRICQNQFALANSESLWIHLNKSMGWTFTIGILFRHPDASKVDNFIEDLLTCITEICSSNETFFILGDINISAVNRSTAANRYINMLLSHGVLPLITLPTRVTDVSATIIDHVLTNGIKHSLELRVMQTQDISDHYPLYCEIGNVPTYKKAEESFGYYRSKYRSKSKFDSDMLNEDLNQALANHFSSVPDLTLNNFNEIFDEFYRLTSKTINQHAPLKRYSRRQRKLLKKPWITKGILTSIKKKNSMFKTNFLYGNASSKLFFKQYFNKLTKIKAMSKHSDFKSELQNHLGDAKKTWEILQK